VRPRRDGKMIFYTLDDQHIGRLFEQGLEHVEERTRRRVPAPVAHVKPHKAAAGARRARAESASASR